MKTPKNDNYLIKFNEIDIDGNLFLPNSINLTKISKDEVEENRSKAYKYLF